MDFNYNVGYRGTVILSQGTTTAAYLLATGGNITVSSQPIYTTGVWGAGWKSASEKIAFAPNYVTLQASINYQVTTKALQAVHTVGWSERYVSHQFSILPNGVAGYKGSALCTGCTFSAAQDALITGDISLKSAEVTGSFIKGSACSNDSSNSLGTASTILSSSTANYCDVYPFWASQVSIMPVSQIDSNTILGRASSISSVVSPQNTVTDWSAQYSSDVNFIMTCCGTTESAYTSTNSGVFSPAYASIGLMDASGSITILGIPAQLNAKYVRKKTQCQITMHPGNDSASTSTINMYNCLFQSQSFDVKTGSQVISSQFNITVLGVGGNYYPMQFTVPSTQ